ncbi:TonB-dependent receptor [Chondrinema litorale]|uniref:TonB-dependent receptor n=1 Tax=Chondrinema litorale TaxID=2994555 RepID=UPI0025434080|nr:TonB-dependent receptor [Chondrinema litorale]UZR96693.1 TonB-dependent receptor [Chondrinema litorale]
MKALLLNILFVLASTFLYAQTTIQGYVKDKRNNPIVGANVYIKDSYDGTTSRPDGFFTFTTRKTGEQTLVFHLMGFKDSEQKITVGSEPIEVSGSMEEMFLELAEATVTASRYFEASDQNRATVLKPIDIMTIGGSNSDITSALRTMPGTQQIGEQEGLFVRGGTGDETKIFVDGLMVNNFYQRGTPGVSQRGRFSPDLFKGSHFSSGGYSAMYGQALSSTLILETQDLPEQSTTEASITSVGVSADLNLLAKNEKSSFTSSVNYMNLAPYYNVVKQSKDFVKMPEYLNGSVNFRTKTSKTGMLKFLGMYGTSAVSLNENSLDYLGNKDFADVDNSNIYTNLTYSDWLKDDLKINTGLSASTNTDKYYTEVRGDDQIHSKQGVKYGSQLYQARTVLTKYFSNYFELNFGGEVQHVAENSTWSDVESGSDSVAGFTDNFSSVFIESNIELVKNLKARAGVRMEYSSLLQKMNIAPRLSLAYLLSEQEQFLVSYGQYYQKPNREYLYYDGLDYGRSDHYIVSYQKRSGLRTIRTEIFYKKYHNLIETVPSVNNGGYGYAKGFELFWRDKKTVRNLDYWVSYSYLDTKRKFMDYPILAQPTFAANHTASLVMKRYIPELSLSTGLTYSYSSGRPYFNPNRPDSEFLSDKVQNYHNVSFLLAYLTKIRKANAIVVLSMSNLLGSKQVFGYEYSNVDTGIRREVTPLAPRFVMMGVFLTWGMDRRQQTIDGLL